MSLNAPRLLAAALLAALLTWLAAWRPFSADTPSEKYFLELTAAASLQGSYNVKLDEGHGVGFEVLPDFRSASDPRILFVRLPPGRVRSFQVTAFSTPGVALTQMRIRRGEGDIFADIPRSALKPGDHTEEMTRADATGFRAGNSSARHFDFHITPAEPLVIPSGNEPALIEVIAIFLLISGGLYWLLGRADSPALAPWRARAASATALAANHPALTLLAVAIAVAIASSYPVVFCGKSFVSPNHYATLLYDQQPAVPGAPVEQQENPKGADLGAMMWQTQPYSALVSQTILRDHELPLWNRHSSGGISLLAQDLSMAADPLNLLTIFANGAPWSWDLRFVLAKALFSLGLGLCAWRLTGRLGVSALLAASAAWIGYFAFRFNHPAIFSLCYAPWVLLPWLAAARAGTRRAAWLWALALIAADWAELNSGTGKESSILLLSLNAAGLLELLLQASAKRSAAAEIRHSSFVIRHSRSAAPLLAASLLFLLLSAPTWLLFIDALKHSFTVYDVPKAYQLQPSLALGFFDELFTQDFSELGNHTNPSLNFLVLSGVLWFFAAGRSLRQNRLALALAIACVPVAAMVFGIVPPSLVVKLPVIGNIQHIHNTFGCVLMILLLVLAAAGWSDCLEETDAAAWHRTWRRVCITLGVLVLAYLGFTQAIPQPPYNLFTIKAPLHSVFFLWCAPLLVLAAAALPWALRTWRDRGPYRAAGAAAFVLCLVVIHFRHGMYVATKFDDFVMNPKTRVPLAAHSPALDRVRQELREPARVAGFGDVFFPGYNVLLGLETISGAEPLQNPLYRELHSTDGITNEWGWRLRIDENKFAADRGFYDLMGIRYFLRATGPGAPPALKPLAQADLEILENDHAWPRAFFTDYVGSYRSTEEFCALMNAAQGTPFAAVQGAVTSPPADYAQRKVVAARDYHLTPNTTELTVTAPSPGLIVVGETFEEGNFDVTVNGAPAPYLRIDHFFKGVKVDRAGEYRVRFAYHPRFLTLSLWLSALGLLLTATASLIMLRPAPARATAKSEPVAEPVAEPVCE